MTDLLNLVDIFFKIVLQMYLVQSEKICASPYRHIGSIIQNSVFLKRKWNRVCGFSAYPDNVPPSLSVYQQRSLLWFYPICNRNILSEFSFLKRKNVIFTFRLALLVSNTFHNGQTNSQELNGDQTVGRTDGVNDSIPFLFSLFNRFRQNLELVINL